MKGANVSEKNGSATAAEKKREMIEKKREMIAELKAMNRIERALRDVPAFALKRVGEWTSSYAADLAAAKFLELDDNDLPTVPRDAPLPVGDDDIAF